MVRLSAASEIFIPYHTQSNINCMYEHFGIGLYLHQIKFKIFKRHFSCANIIFQSFLVRLSSLFLINKLKCSAFRKFINHHSSKSSHSSLTLARTCAGKSNALILRAIAVGNIGGLQGYTFNLWMQGQFKCSTLISGRSATQLAKSCHSSFIFV